VTPVSGAPAVPPWQAFHYVPATASSILDVGCGSGATLQGAYELGVRDLHGIDINRHAIEMARSRLASLPGVDTSKIVHGSADALPFADEMMDVVTAFETIEHVPAELRVAVIREIWRVLRPGGRLVITVPAAGLFSWLDPANVRFWSPSLFACIDKLFGGRGRERGYEGQKHGIVWHHHFTDRELRAILEPHFVIERTRWRGCVIAPLCAGLAFPFYRMQKFDHPILRLLHRAEFWELSFETGQRLACNVLVVAGKADLGAPLQRLGDAKVA
jgi:SAM-dependent methyltransferase